LVIALALGGVVAQPAAGDGGGDVGKSGRLTGLSPRSASAGLALAKGVKTAKKIVVTRVTAAKHYDIAGCPQGINATITKPVIVKGVPKRARKAFAKRINTIIAEETESAKEFVEGIASECAKYPSPAKLDVKLDAADVYAKRYVSVAFDVWFDAPGVVSSCKDHYRTLTFDTVTRRPVKLARLVNLNHGQALNYSWFQAAMSLGWATITGGLSTEEGLEIPAGRGPSEFWTVSKDGVTFWFSAGSGNGCQDGPQSVLMSWDSFLKRGEMLGVKKTYRKVPVVIDDMLTGETRESGQSGTVTVQGRSVRVKYCHPTIGCATYWGVRNGSAYCKVVAEAPAMGSPDRKLLDALSVAFAGESAKARPIGLDDDFQW
jgi:hypothetical protein